MVINATLRSDIMTAHTIRSVAGVPWSPTTISNLRKHVTETIVLEVICSCGSVLHTRVEKDQMAFRLVSQRIRTHRNYYIRGGYKRKAHRAAPSEGPGVKHAPRPECPRGDWHPVKFCPACRD